MDRELQETKQQIMDYLRVALDALAQATFVVGAQDGADARERRWRTGNGTAEIVWTVWTNDPDAALVVDGKRYAATGNANALRLPVRAGTHVCRIESGAQTPPQALIVIRGAGVKSEE